MRLLPRMNGVRPPSYATGPSQPCDQAWGACCASNGECALLDVIRCNDLNRDYRGQNTSCSADICNRPCPCDWNGNGILDVRDLLIFTQDYLGGAADFNGDGTTSEADMREFAGCMTSNRPAACQ